MSTVVKSRSNVKNNAEGSSPVLKYQVLKDVDWRQLSSGQMVGHPINPYNPSSDYKQGDVITGREVSVSYKDYSGKDPKNVTGNFIEISSNKYIPRNAVAIYSGGKPVGGKDSFSGAEGSSPILKYRVISDANYFHVYGNGQVINASGGGFKIGDIVSGREKILNIMNNGWVKWKAIELAPNKYIWSKNVVLDSGSKPTGDKQSFSGTQITNKINTGGFVMGVTFGLLGTSIGVILGVNTKTVIVLAGAGTVIGSLVGIGLNAENFSGADGKCGTSSFKSIACYCKGIYHGKISEERCEKSCAGHL